ncbi:MAG TPA: hypothetical protein VIS09_22395 [Streptomyces sp.]
MKTNPYDSSEYSVGPDGVSKRITHHLRLLLKRAGRGPLDLGYEALRGAAYKSGGALISALFMWVATRR